MIYFARPDSVINGIEVNAYREELGRRLAETAPPPPSADIVVGVPDSGTPAALGYARTSSIPYTNALIKNRYVGRTFIQPSQALRELGIRMKLNFLPSAIQGKSVVLIDDSIVRGNTPRALVALLREGGAREVHMRISSPPILWGCHYGIAMRDEELIARHLGGDPEAIRRQVGADSLSYLDLGEALAATSKPQDSFCTACFSGLFPAGLSEA
jgi:amidophosphoribosyltransferase